MNEGSLKIVRAASAAPVAALLADGLLQLAAGGVVIADPSGRIVHATQAAATLHGFASGEELAAADALEIDARVEVLDEWGRAAFASRLPQLGSRDNDAPEVHLRFRDRGSREESVILLRTSAIRDEAGRVRLLVAVYRDVTGLKRTEESLRLLSRAGAAFGGPHDLHSALDALGRLLLPDLADCAVVELARQDAALEWPERLLLRNGAAPRTLGPCAEPLPLQAGLAQPIPLRAQGRLFPLAEAGCVAAVVAPLLHQGRQLGLLMFGVRPGRRRFGPQDLAQAEDLATRFAACLEGARRSHELRLARTEEARRAHAFELAHRISLCLQREQRTSDALEAAAEAIRREVGARLVRIWSCPASTPAMELQASSCDPAERPLPVLEAGEVRRVADEGAVRVIADLRLDPLLSGCGPGTLALLPLPGPSMPSGAIALFFASGIAADLPRALQPALDLLGLALHRSRGVAEAEAARRDAELAERAQAAAEARRKDQFIAVLAHELRNPLAPIVTALGLMRTREGDGKTIARERALVERQVGQMVRLVDDLLDVSRVASGKLELRKEPIDLLSVVARAVEASQPLMSRFRHTLSVSMPETGLFLVGDAGRLAQVISNLLNNAAKYTPPNGRVRLLVERDGAEAVIRVRDTGIGIPPELKDRLFEPFVQGSERPDHAGGGLGIGLSLVKAMVELHGGQIGFVTGGPGNGTEFTVRLPALPDLELALPLLPDPHEEALRPLGRRVLVVDDNHDAAEMMSEALQEWGCDVRVATDGAAALASAHEWHPDVILLDIGMPVMDGHEVARRLRRDPALARIHLIAVTGYGREMDQRQSREVGFDLHLTKPVELEVLQRAIASSPQPASPRNPADTRPAQAAAMPVRCAAPLPPPGLVPRK